MSVAEPGGAEATAAERERLEASLAEAEHRLAAEASALAGARNELVRITADRDAIAKQFSNAELKELANYVGSLEGDLKVKPENKFR